MLKTPEMFILRTQLYFSMYQKLKLQFTQEVSIQDPIVAYTVHTVYLATDLLRRPKGRERVKVTTAFGTDAQWLHTGPTPAVTVRVSPLIN